MTIRVGINGFGRIGRLVFRAAQERNDIDIVGINDLIDVEYMAYMLRYDTMHGQFKGSIEIKDGKLVVNGKAIRVTAEKNPADIAALGALEVNGQTLEAIRTGLVGKIGENMTFRRFKRVEAQGKLHQYVHGGSKIGVLVDMIGGNDEVGHDIAMHIAALKPKALDANGVDPELLATERRVAVEKAREAGKPEAMLERIAEGTVQKYLKEVTLLSQPFVKNDKMSVAELLKQNGASIASFVLFVVGEGIEKKQTDFAAEVAEQMAAAQKA